MKIAVKVWNYETFFEMTKLNVEKIRIGIKDLSIQFNDYFNINDIEKLCLNKANSKISVAINKFFLENEVEFLTQQIKLIAKYEIDEILFCDLAVAQIIYEEKINIKLHYNPETIMTNYEQIYFYHENGIENFTISNGLTKKEIKEMIKNKKESQLEVQVFGQTMFMYSRWPLMSNFNKYLKTKNEKLPKEKFYIIQEKTRDVPNYMYEEVNCTSMYSGFILNLSKLIKDFQETGLDFIFIEPLFQNENWLKNSVIIFQKIIKNEINESSAYEQLAQLNEDLINSESFLGDLKNLPSFRNDNE